MKFIIEYQFINETDDECNLYKELHELLDYYELVYFRKGFRQIHLGDFRKFDCTHNCAPYQELLQMLKTVTEFKDRIDHLEDIQP